jgi:dTDP-4-amino-4,6-dideoxygalactose transaminase
MILSKLYVAGFVKGSIAKITVAKLEGKELDDALWIILANWHVFELRFDGNRDGLVKHLETRDIQTNVYYVVPHHLQPALAHLGYRKGSLPNTKRVCGEVIALPLYFEMNESVIDAVVSAVRDFPDSGHTDHQGA